MKNPEKIKQGKRFKEAGARFERKVRADLESKGWIVDRWSNQVDLGFKTDVVRIEFNPSPEEKKLGTALNATEGRLVKAKSFMGRTRSNGFPDFIIFKKTETFPFYRVNGVEVKMKGKLRKEEKEKCSWLLKNKIFGGIFVASKAGRMGVKYEEITIIQKQAVR